MCLTLRLLGSYRGGMAPQPSRPMPVVRLPEPFDHPDWLFEVKHDGFRALAHIGGHYCDMRSRNGHTFKHWPQHCEELAHAVKAHDAIIDGEIVCLDRRGRSNFKNLLFRRDWPYFYALRSARSRWRGSARVATDRTQAPAAPADSVSAHRLLYVDYIEARGRHFFEVACAHDLEGIVAKPANGRYHSTTLTIRR
jgi:bifunctional non-homologous end joining protein LigD